MTLHQERDHPTLVEDCYACRISQVSFGAGTSLTKKGSEDAIYKTKFEAGLEKDRPAYKEMRKQGLRPAKMFGADKMMNQARTKFEIESGKLMPDVPAGTINRAVAEAEGALGGSIKNSSAVAL